MNLVWLIPFLPLLGFLIIGLFPKFLSKKIVGIIGSGVILASFVIVLTLLVSFVFGDAEPRVITLFEWIPTGSFTIGFSFLIDRLSVLMMSIITGVGFLIHLYSIGYMHDDEGFARYFAYLNLFVFSMLLLVMASNYLLMFAGWEGVGLCSYLLIGFWFKNTDYNDAAKKAFIMNRIGDFGFLLGMLLLILTFGSLDFHSIFTEAPKIIPPNSGVVIGITLLLLVGAVGKSAQIPLYTWLPDAMAGPTPVSALIHAATMVTAGIYMIVRSNVLYSLAPFTLHIIVIIGIVTALFAATIALVQNDIKKILAYSTVSQLGYMFFALGLGAYSTAIFHLTTHAFFKALLFLGAGSVIHGTSNEQDLRNLGGLKSKMPITYITFLVASLAISGVPPFAGFFSKDAILAHAWVSNPILWVLGVLGALMTAFYMFRLLFLTFNGSYRGKEDTNHPIHESSLRMTIPLVVLGVLSLIGGWIGIPELFHGNNAIHNYLNPLVAAIAPTAPEIAHSTEWILTGISTVLVLLVIAFAYIKYVKNKAMPSFKEEQYSVPHKLLYHKYYIDEIYNALIVKPILWLSALGSLFDVKVVDELVNIWGKGVKQGSSGLKVFQNGSISYYLFAMVIGIIVLLFIATNTSFFTTF